MAELQYLSDKMKGKVWKFKDNIDTDLILPGRYLIYSDVDKLKNHCMEGIDEEFSKKFNKGDFIVAGKNFGCGSSREHAPLALKGLGVSAIIAESFARIFYRNAINVGIPLLEVPDISNILNDKDCIDVNISESTITLKNGDVLKFKEIPSFMLDIVNKGGLVEYLKK